jgi:hypothetical protein
MKQSGTLRPPFLSSPNPYPGLVRVYPLYGLDKTRLGPALATGTVSFGNSPGVRGFDYGGLAWDNPGINSSINTQDKIETLTGGSAGSVSLWFRPTRAFNNGSDEFLLGQAGGTTNSFEIRRYGPFGQWFCGFYNGSDMRAQPTTTATNWLQNQWQHLVVTWVNGGTAIIYHNGRDLGNHSVTLTAGSPSGNLAISGADPTDSSSTFAGSIADVRVFNRALSPTEVELLYSPQTRFNIYPSGKRNSFFAPTVGGGTIWAPSLPLLGMG